MMLGFSAEVIEEPPILISVVYNLVEKPTNRLFVVDVIAVIGGQLFG